MKKNITKICDEFIGLYQSGKVPIEYQHQILDEQETEKQIASKCIDALSNAKIPVDYIDRITCGDNFRNNLMQAKKWITNLKDRQGYEQILLSGTWGSGKTHFLTYLTKYLSSYLPENTVVSSINLRNFTESDDLEYLIIKNLKFINSKKGYNEVLYKSFINLKENFGQKNPTSNLKKVDEAYINLLSDLLSGSIKTITNIDIKKFLNNTNLIKNLIAFFKPRNKKDISYLLKNSDNQYTDFLSAYFNIISEKDAPRLNTFEKHAKKLSKDNKLTDLIFRAIKSAGTNLLIILIDELETTNTSVLNTISDFLDNFNNVYNIVGEYPSTAVFISVPYLNIDNENLKNSSLHRRLKSKRKIEFNPLSNSDIDNVIYKLRELYFLNDIDLKPIIINEEKNTMDSFRSKVIDEYTKTEINTDNLLKIIDKLIQKEWIK